MKILLLNSNPVVGKLVTLSAQKTKDELVVLEAIEQIDGGEYDLLILDDGLYSAEAMDIIDSSVVCSERAFMANRNVDMPEGFAHKINKPFLPTDLVDLFLQISSSIESSAASMGDDFSMDDLDRVASTFDDIVDDIEDTPLAIDLEDTILNEPSVLDKEDLQEVQGLLDEDLFGDIEIDDLDDVKDTPIEQMDDDIDKLIASDMESEKIDKMADGDFSIDDILGETTEDFDLDDILGDSDKISDDEEFNLDDLVASTVAADDDAIEDDFSIDDLSSVTTDELDDNLLDDILGSETATEDEDFSIDDLLKDTSIEDDLKIDDLVDESTEDFNLDDLVDDIKPTEDFNLDDIAGTATEDEFDLGDILGEEVASNDDFSIDDLSLVATEDDTKEPEIDEDFSIDDLDDDKIDEALDIADDDLIDGLDELDMLDEAELKLAIGEDVLDDEIMIEPLDDMVDNTPVSTEVSVDKDSQDAQEALTALMKMLSNEDVMKSLKGLNINININFGQSE